MPTFGSIVDITEVKATKTSAPRDMSYLEPYKSAITELQNSGPGKAMTLTLDEPGKPTEKNALKTAARHLNLVLGMRATKDKTGLSFWIEEGKTPAPTGYQKLAAEAKAAGVSVAEYRKQKAAQKPAGAKVGRPAKNANGATTAPELVGAPA